MKKPFVMLFLAAGITISAVVPKSRPGVIMKSYATCKGDSPCNACKNCKYCKRCAKEGLTCGVCKK